MSEQTPSSMHDDLAKAFNAQAELNEFIADESAVLDRGAKMKTRNKLKNLMGMLDQVKQYKDDVPADIIQGMEEVIVNTEAKLDGKPMHFKSDEDVSSTINQMAA
jgi:hypothetical protein